MQTSSNKQQANMSNIPDHHQPPSIDSDNTHIGTPILVEERCTRAEHRHVMVEHET